MPAGTGPLGPDALGLADVASSPPPLHPSKVTIGRRVRGPWLGGNVL